MLIRRSSFSLLCTLSAALLIVGCAASVVRPAPQFTWGQSIDFQNVHFDFNSAEVASSFTNFVNQRTYSSDTFVIVDVTMINKSDKPRRSNFSPNFSLIDSAGATYALDAMKTIQINMAKPGRAVVGQDMNPNVKVRQQLVFEAPKQKYKLQVLVPNSAEVGFNGAINLSGPYFLVDIGPQLEN